MHSKPMSPITTLLFLTSALSAPAWAADAHLHGVAEMTLVEDAGTLVLELQAPGMSLAGFEHAPKNAVDATKISAVLGELSDAGKVVSIDGGDCKRVRVDAKSSYPSEQKTVHDHDHHDDSTHNAFAASYQFQCAKPVAITGLQLPLLKTFPGIETLSVQWIIQGKQGAAQIGSAQLELKF